MLSPTTATGKQLLRRLKDILFPCCRREAALPTREDDPEISNKGHAMPQKDTWVMTLLLWGTLLLCVGGATVVARSLMAQWRVAKPVVFPLSSSHLALLEHMEAHLQSHKSVPCVAAQQFGTHVKLVVVRGEGVFAAHVRMANPVVSPDPDNAMRSKDMWPSADGTEHEVIVHKSILVHYYDPITGDKRKAKYSDTASSCLQHVDVAFAGHEQLRPCR